VKNLRRAKPSIVLAEEKVGNSYAVLRWARAFHYSSDSWALCSVLVHMARTHMTIKWKVQHCHASFQDRKATNIGGAPTTNNKQRAEGVPSHETRFGSLMITHFD
jgi:hypothetical protein